MSTGAGPDLIRGIIDRWNSGDAALDRLHSQIVWDASDFPDGQVYRGHEGVARFVQRWVGSWDEYRIELEDLFETGDRVVALVRELGRSRTADLEVALESMLVFWVEDGLVVRFRGFLDRAAGMRELGVERAAG